ARALGVGLTCSARGLVEPTVSPRLQNCTRLPGRLAARASVSSRVFSRVSRLHEESSDESQSTRSSSGGAAALSQSPALSQVSRQGGRARLSSQPNDAVLGTMLSSPRK